MKNKGDFLIHIFFLVCIAVLVIGFLFLLGEVKDIKLSKSGSVIEYITNAIQASPEPKVTASSSPTPTTVSKSPTATQTEKAKKVTYVDFSQTTTTTATDWTDITGSDVALNISGDFGEDAYVSWEAVVNTKNTGNQVFVRLYDVTNKIAVNSSELDSTATTSTRISSSRLYLWRGENVYRVQVKSLNGQEVTFSSGKIKIVD